jgi:hypothetical protein
LSIVKISVGYMAQSLLFILDHYISHVLCLTNFCRHLAI